MRKKTTVKGQASLFDALEASEASEGATRGDAKDTSSTFTANLALAVHRWFRYSAGFSAAWVREVIEREKEKGRNRVFDPFVGSGTVVLESEYARLRASGLKPIPSLAGSLKRSCIGGSRPKPSRRTPCRSWRKRKRKRWRGMNSRLLWESVSHLKRWAGLRRFAASCMEGRTALPYLSCRGWPCAPFSGNAPPSERRNGSTFFRTNRRSGRWTPSRPSRPRCICFPPTWPNGRSDRRGRRPRLLLEDARECKSIPTGWADLVITSPPYANNYDYADATRLEMTFFGEIEGWGCLQEAVRKHLVRSCTQHVAPLTKQTDGLIQAAVLAPISRELSETCRKLAQEREGHGGKKNYHTMIAAYFKDMAEVWLALRRVAAEGRACLLRGRRFGALWDLRSG